MILGIAIVGRRRLKLLYTNTEIITYKAAVMGADKHRISINEMKVCCMKPWPVPISGVRRWAFLIALHGLDSKDDNGLTAKERFMKGRI